MIGMRRKARRDAAGAGVSSSFGPLWGRSPTCPGRGRPETSRPGSTPPCVGHHYPFPLCSLAPVGPVPVLPGYALYSQFLSRPPEARIIGESCAMHCLYCGKSFRMASRVFNDPDFCRPPHRWKFHKRLDTAIHFIQRSTELHPAGQPGFRIETVFLDRPFRSTLGDPVHGALPFVLPGLRATITSEALVIELPDEVAADREESAPSRETMDRAARVEHLSAIMAQLRADVERRRSEAHPSTGRTLAPVVEFRPAAPDPRESSLSALCAALSSDSALAGRRPAPRQALKAACT